MCDDDSRNLEMCNSPTNNSIPSILGWIWDSTIMTVQLPKERGWNEKKLF
jgi:hypothetical protein